MDALFCAPDSPRPELLGVQQASTGWVNKYLLSYRLPDGTPFTYESASRERSAAAYEAALRRHGQGEPVASEAVCVVPMLPDGELMLIKEFRYPVNSWVVAFPAGLIDEGEDEVTAISRELAEEVGLRVRTELGQRAVRMLPQAPSCRWITQARLSQSPTSSSSRSPCVARTSARSWSATSCP